MSELAATAERLRLVKEASIDFITLWALDRMMEENRLSDQICIDLEAAPGEDVEDFSFSGSSLLLSDRYLDD